MLKYLYHITILILIIHFILYYINLDIFHIFESLFPTNKKTISPSEENVKSLTFDISENMIEELQNSINELKHLDP